jgi:hypothetical protein
MRLLCMCQDPPPTHTHTQGCPEVLSFTLLSLLTPPLTCACCVGAKKREEIYTAFENIYPTLKEYKKREAAEAAGLGPLASKPSGVLGWVGQLGMLAIWATQAYVWMLFAEQPHHLTIHLERFSTTACGECQPLWDDAGWWHSHAQMVLQPCFDMLLTWCGTATAVLQMPRQPRACQHLAATQQQQEAMAAMACSRLAAVQQQQLVGYKGQAAPCCPQHPAVATCHLQLQQQQQAVCFPQQRRPPTCLLPRRSTPRLPPLPTCPPPPLASTTCPLPRRVTRCPACLPTRHQGCLCQAWHHPCPASQSSSSSRHCRWRWCCRAVHSPVGNGCGSWNGSSTAVPLACWLVGTAPTAAGHECLRS